MKLASLDFDLDKGGNDFEASFIVDSDVVDVAVRVAMVRFFFFLICIYGSIPIIVPATFLFAID